MRPFSQETPKRERRRLGETNVRKMKTLSALVLAVGLSVVALTGCSGGTATPASSSSSSSGASQEAEPSEASSDQSVADACTTATASVSGLQSELTDISTDVQAGNFSVVAEKLNTLTTTLQTTAGDISNSEVKGALTTLAEKVGDFAGIFAGATDGDLAGFADKVDELQTVSQEVATAGQAMSDLCS